MRRPETGHVTVKVDGGVMEVRLPVELLGDLAKVDHLTDAALRKRLPVFGRELAEGFTGQLAEPPVAVREPERVNVVRIVLTRTTTVGTTVIELDNPAEVFT